MKESACVRPLTMDIEIRKEKCVRKEAKKQGGDLLYPGYTSCGEDLRAGHPVAKPYMTAVNTSLKTLRNITTKNES